MDGGDVGRSAAMCEQRHFSKMIAAAEETEKALMAAFGNGGLKAAAGDNKHRVAGLSDAADRLPREAAERLNPGCHAMQFRAQSFTQPALAEGQHDVSEVFRRRAQVDHRPNPSYLLSLPGKQSEFERREASTTTPFYGRGKPLSTATRRLGQFDRDWRQEKVVQSFLLGHLRAGRTEIAARGAHGNLAASDGIAQNGRAAVRRRMWQPKWRLRQDPSSAVGCKPQRDTLVEFFDAWDELRDRTRGDCRICNPATAGWAWCLRQRRCRPAMPRTWPCRSANLPYDGNTGTALSS